MQNESKEVNPVKSFYNQHGSEYVDLQRKFYSGLSDSGRECMRRFLVKEISDKVLLDMGCGAGDDLLAYAEMGAGQVIGVDLSETMLKEARTTLGKKELPISLLLGGWEEIPLPDESINIVTARYSFHLIRNLNKGYLEVARILKHGGMFIFAVPHPLFDARAVSEQKLEASEDMKSPIFEGRFTVEYPPHTRMDEYLSEECLNRFVVEEVFEYSMHEREEDIPTGLVVKLRKK